MTTNTSTTTSTTTTTFTNTTNSSITNNSKLDRSPPQLSPLTSVHNSHKCIAAIRDIILNITLQRCRGFEWAARIGREGGRFPIVKQVECIVLQLRFLSKLRVIVLAAPVSPMFPTYHLLYHCYRCPSCFMSPFAS